MRKLILQMQTTVDGFVSGPNGSMNWTVWNFSDNWTWDTELKKAWNDIFSSVDHILLSGNMAAEGYIDHWSAMAEDHKGEAEFAFAQKIRDANKLIFSKSIQEVKWPNSSLAKGELVSGIGELKAMPGKDIIVFGGASFAAALLKAGVIDEIQLFINPAISGGGISIFTGISNLRLQLLSSVPYICGISVLRYLVN